MIADARTSILLAGGTGLVGGTLATRLGARTDVALISLVRRVSRPQDRLVDFDALVLNPVGPDGVDNVDVGVSCLGTTIRAAGSRAAFFRVDHDYVLAFARAARAAGATRFVLVSAVGAGGRGFYLHVKGETEGALDRLGFDRLDLVRPALLIGARTERRPVERLVQAAAPLIDPLLRGRLAKYASIGVDLVADAVERLALRREPGRFVHYGPDLRGMAGPP